MFIELIIESLFNPKKKIWIILICFAGKDFTRQLLRTCWWELSALRTDSQVLITTLTTTCPQKTLISVKDFFKGTFQMFKWVISSV